MTSKKQFTKVTQLIIACLLFFSFQAQSKGYFPTKNSTPAVQKTVKIPQNKSGSFIKKIKTQVKKTLFSKRKHSRKFSKNKAENHYGKIALWALVFCLVSLLSVYFTYGLGVLLGITFNIISFVAARRGINGRDENPKLAETMFTVNLAVYALLALIIGWSFVVIFL